MKLNLETYIALVGSVEKWYGIAYKRKHDHGGEDCPLCHMYYRGRPYHDTCKGCPIKVRTRSLGCSTTPRYHQNDAKRDRRPEAMLEFLLDLEESVTHVDGERL